MFACLITIGIQLKKFAVRDNDLFLHYEKFYFNYFLKAKLASYGESCASTPADTTLLLTCNSANFVVCSGALFWNGTYCGKLIFYLIRSKRTV